MFEFIESQPPIHWVDRVPVPWDASLPSCTRGEDVSRATITTPTVGTKYRDTYYASELVHQRVSNSHITKQLKLRNRTNPNKLTRQQYLHLVSEYVLVSDAELRDCARDEGRCNSIRCRVHGHALALERGRVAGERARRVGVFAYAVVWRGLRSTQAEFRAQVLDNMAVLNAVNARSAAAFVVRELDATGFDHAHGILTASDPVALVDTPALSLRPLDGPLCVPLGLYVVKDTADAATRMGALAQNGGTWGFVAGDFWGAGGYEAARRSHPFTMRDLDRGQQRKLQ